MNLINNYNKYMKNSDEYLKRGLVISGFLAILFTTIVFSLTVDIVTHFETIQEFLYWVSQLLLIQILLFTCKIVGVYVVVFFIIDFFRACLDSKINKLKK